MVENLILADELMWEAERLKTFKNWPFGKNHTCSPEAMARAGFYACGNKEEKDLAKCFVCLKELNGWEANDDPMKEHISHCQNCPFVKLKKVENQITVYEMIDLFKARVVNILDITFKEKMEQFDERVADISQGPG